MRRRWSGPAKGGTSPGRAIAVARPICSLFDFPQKVMRSAPAVMAPQLREAPTVGIARAPGFQLRSLP
jgi:hypothetical protein